MTIRFHRIALAGAAGLVLCTMSGAFAGARVELSALGGKHVISKAMIKARPGDTLLLDDGVYKDHLSIKEGVTVKARNRGKARLNGMGRGTAVIMGTNSTIDGLEIYNATIGVFSRNGNVTIKNCLIYKNWMTGIIAVRQLPKIEDNVIAFNRSSGIQLWDSRSVNASINHNTVAFNGNHGIAVGGSSNVVVENNVIADNQRYGMKVSQESSVKSNITKNNFWQNGIRGQQIKDNYSFDPAFMSARGMLDFRPDPRECCSIKGSDNQNLGARFDF